MMILILLYVFMFVVDAQTIPSFTCPFYSASNTNSAQQNYATCTYTLSGYVQTTVVGSNYC